MTTALDLPPEDLQRYRDAARRRAAPRTLSLTEATAKHALLTRIRQAADILMTRFDVRRVILFGSLAHEAWYAADSDVDLAVEGLRSEDYWRAWRAVEESVGDRPVDLIEIETASDSLRNAIERYGVTL